MHRRSGVMDIHETGHAVGADAIAVEDEAGAEGHVGGAEDEARVVGEEVHG